MNLLQKGKDKYTINKKYFPGPTYRSHGSEYELKVPLMIFNAGKVPPASYFIYNKDLIRWLFEKE